MAEAVSADEGAIRRQVIVGTLWLTGWRMLTRGLGFVSLLALTQLLLPADFGLVALASASAAALESLSQLGVRDALVRLECKAEEHFDAAFTFQAGRGLLTGLLLIAASPVVAGWMGDARLQSILVVLGALAFVGGLENIGTVTLARKLDFKGQVLLQAGPRLAGVIVTILLALWLRSYWALIAGLAFSRVITTATSYALAPHRPRLSLHGWRYLLHFSAWSWGGSIAVLVWAKSDPFLLTPAVGTAALGVYSIAAEIALLPLTELIEPVSTALYSGFAVAHRKGVMAKDAALRIAVAISVIAAPVALGISATSGYVAQAMLGPKWTETQPVIAVIAAICVLSPFSYVAGTTLSAQGYVDRAFYSNATAAAIKVAATLIALRLTTDLRILAATNVAVVACEASLFTWHVIRVMPQPLAPMAGPLARMIAAAAMTGAVLWILPGTWQPTSMPRPIALATGAAIGMACIACHCAIHVSIWRLAGQSAGPESDIMDIAKSIICKLATRLGAGRAARA